MLKDEIHVCEFKRGKLQEAMTDRNDNFYCCRCFKQVPINQVHPKLLENKK
jgi:hypothetical protein